MAETTINGDSGTVTIGDYDQNQVAKVEVSGHVNVQTSSFNLPEGHTLNMFGLTDTASLFWEVTGGSSSNILGNMNIFNLAFILQNTAGINFGSNAIINLSNASLIAATLPLNLSATDFIARNYVFGDKDAQGGFLMNEGRILGGKGDLVALIANALENKGTIEVPMGTVALAAGNTVTVGISPDGMVSIGVDEATANTMGLRDQIKNTGTLSAQGGRVVLDAEAADGLFDKAINLAKEDSATSVVIADDGAIEFVANGDITNNGTLQAKRGSIEIDTTGTIETRGILRAETFREHGYTFRIGGVMDVGHAVMKNLDHAADILEGAVISGSYEDVDDINVLGNFSLGGDTTIWADSDEIGDTGGIFWSGDYTVTGNNHDLTLKASEDSTIGSVTGVKVFTLAGTRGATPVYTAHPTTSSWTSITDFQINSDAKLNRFTGTGTGGDPYMVHDVYGLQAMKGYLSDTFKLANDIDATSTSGWNGGSGFDQIGGSGTPFIGTLNGNSKMISGLTISRSGEDYVGLFGYTSGATIQNIGLVGGSVTGAHYVGGLVGKTTNSTNILNSYVTAAISGGSHNFIGGLVGYDMDSSISNSYATGNVSGSWNVGGLVGLGRDSTITDCYATGDVRGNSYVGGLVGSETQTSEITNSYATGDVTGMGTSDYIGGLVGYDGGATSISNSFATGTVTGTSNVGGFIGSYVSSGALNNNWWYSDAVSGIGNTGDAGVAQAGALSDFYGAGAGTGGAVYSAWDFTEGAGFWNSFSGVNPHLDYEWAADITTLLQLQNMNLNLAADYTLANDIDASITSTWNWDTDHYEGFDPIGDGSQSFSGDFDGDSHVISGLTIDRVDENYLGLFGATSGGMIQKVGLVDVDIKTNEDFMGSFVGGFVGYNLSSTITNVYVTGSIDSGEGGINIGGFVGRNDGTISRSCTSVDVMGGTGSQNVGGFAGSNTGTISYSYSAGDVAGGMKVGGFVGLSSGAASVSYVYSSGAVSGSEAGGLVGRNMSGSYISSYWDATENPTLQDSGSGDLANVTGKTTTALMTESTFTADGWDFDYDGSGAGATGDWIMAGMPHLQMEWNETIANVVQLQMMSLDVGANYTLANDIDASITSTWNWDTDHYAGFSPVGDGFAPFTGTFDGQEHIISDLMINRPTADLAGLFGATNSGAVIQNVGLVDVDITGGFDVGALVGYGLAPGANTVITNVYVDGGTVMAMDTDNSLVGGLAGGGLLDISDSYAAVDVTGSGHNNLAGPGGVGGLLGYTGDGSITNCYATGNVNGGGAEAGGLVGILEYVTITNSFATGTVTNAASGKGGGLVGSSIYGATVTNSYYLDDMHGDQTGKGAYESNGISAFYNPAHAVYDPYNAGGNRWGFNGGSSAGWVPVADNDAKTASLPILSWQSEAVTMAGSGTPVDPYLITNVGQLQTAIYNLEKSFKLANDINADIAGYNTGEGFVPIGNSSDAFVGVFDGDGNAINGLFIDRGIDNVGLFGISGVGSQISDVGLVGGSISSSESYVGSIAGKNYGTITGVYNTGIVSGDGDCVGGLVGYSHSLGTIIDSYNEGIISGGGDYVGGLVGASDGSIAGSHNTGSVDGTGDYTGGLTGWSEVSIEDSYNEGAVTGVRYTGGLVGSNHGAMTGSYNTGIVLGSGEQVGGLAGSNRDTITDSYNTGTVTSTADYVGGLAGYNDSTIGSSYNEGVVSGEGIVVGETVTDPSDYVGGLVGQNEGTIEDSYNVGAFSSDGAASFVGGLAGDNNGLIRRSYNSGNFSGIGGGDYLGGLAGLNRNSITDSYNTGTIESDWDYVGGLVGENDGYVSNSYNAGSVSGGHAVGGLVGIHTDDASPGSSLEDSYNVGAVEGDFLVSTGGVIGIYTSGPDTDITNVWYIDNPGTLVTWGIGNDHTDPAEVHKQTGATTAEAKSAFYNPAHAVYDVGVANQWGFNGGSSATWVPVVNNDAKTASLPILSWQDGAVLMSGTGVDIDHPYLITNVGQLQLMAYGLAGFYELSNDINADIAGYNTGEGFDPVGEAGGYFDGVFEGNSYNIMNLTINRPDEDLVGLFAAAWNTSIIRNVNLVGGSVTGHDKVGSILGLSDSALVSNVSSSVAVTGNNEVGGLVGLSNGTITGSDASGSVTGATGFVGGLTGLNAGTISNSYATGEVSGGGMVGGLAAYNTGIIEDSHATGGAEGDNYIGGLVGENAGGSITNSYATGVVEGAGNYIGGLVGQQDPGGSTVDSYATGDVSGDDTIGGLVGLNQGTITSSHATGTVSGDSNLGGLVGLQNSGGTTTDSYFTDASHNNYIGTLQLPSSPPPPAVPDPTLSSFNTIQTQTQTTSSTQVASTLSASIWQDPSLTPEASFESGQVNLVEEMRLVFSEEQGVFPQNGVVETPGSIVPTDGGELTSGGTSLTDGEMTDNGEISSGTTSPAAGEKLTENTSADGEGKGNGTVSSEGNSAETDEKKNSPEAKPDEDKGESPKSDVVNDDHGTLPVLHEAREIVADYFSPGVAKNLETRVRVSEGKVYVRDGTHGLQLLGGGESVRVWYKDPQRQSPTEKDPEAASSSALADINQKVQKMIEKDLADNRANEIQQGLSAGEALSGLERLNIMNTRQDVGVIPGYKGSRQTLPSSDVILKNPIVSQVFSGIPLGEIKVKNPVPVAITTTKDGMRYGTLKNPGKDVFVKCEGGEWQAARDGMVILPGDVVKTATTSSAEVMLDDGKVGRVEIRGGSLFRINKSESDPVTGDQTTLLDLALGKILVEVRSLKGNSRFEVKTPTALTGVRGTVFEVVVKEKF